MLITILSKQEVGKRIRNLEGQLTKQLRESPLDSVLEEFWFHPQYHYIPALGPAISMLVVGGAITSWSNGTQEIRQGVHNLALNMRNKLNHQEVQYLTGVGRSLVTEN